VRAKQAVSYAIRFDRGSWPWLKAHIIADDCLVSLLINQQPQKLEQICTWPRGTLVDLGELSATNTNRMYLIAGNLQGRGGVDVEFYPFAVPVLPLLKSAVLASLMLALCLMAGLDRRLGAGICALLYASLLLTFRQYFSTDYTQYAMDVRGHTHYILDIAERLMIPEPFGWQSQQPPLYYIAAALFYKAGALIGMAEPIYASRFFSLLLHVGFLIVSLLTLARFITDRRLLALASALVLFWPEGVLVPGRISNDLGINFTHALFIYFMVLWDQTRRLSYLRYALVCVCMALMVKGTAVIIVAVAGTLCLIALLRKQLAWRELFYPPLVALGMLSLAVAFGRTLMYRLAGHDIKWMMNVNPAALGDRLAPNHLSNYLYFDIKSFVADPFFYSVLGGSPYFWNAFLKQLLLGEWFWKNPDLASALSAVLVVLLGFVLWFLCRRVRRAEMESLLPLLVTMLWMLAALIAARITVPWPAQCNGRYIYSIIVIWAILLFRLAEQAQREKKPVLAKAVTATSLLFCLLSVLVIALEQPWVLP
jgi:hypothetical protein